jgi:Fur family ferric uptake transcriptional regulator
LERETDYRDRLKKSGLKYTKHRTAILDILSQSDPPLAAEQIYLALQERGLPANLSTVYRTIETLAEKNLLKKRSLIGDSRVLFEYNRAHHSHYLVCLGCKKMLAIRRCPLGDYEEKLGKETNYTIAGHNLDVYGYCPECRIKGFGGLERRMKRIPEKKDDLSGAGAETFRRGRNLIRR